MKERLARIDKRSLGYMLAFASAATGAVRYNLAVYADLRGFGHVWFLFGMLIIGVLSAGIHVGVEDGWAGLRKLKGHRNALLYGVLMGWSTLATFLALDYLNETVMSSLQQTSILVTLVLAVWLLGERFTKAQWIATTIICVGILAFRPWSGETRAIGVTIILSGAVTGAMASVGAKRWVVGIPPRILMLWRNSVALIITGAWILFAEGGTPILTFWTVVACIAAGILGPYLHGLTFLMALQRIDAGKAALMSRVQPVIVFLVSWAFLSRTPAGEDIWGGVLLVVGVVILALTRKK
ncbi:MAG: DMT family transporter [Planctomycetota bacterium]